MAGEIVDVLNILREEYGGVGVQPGRSSEGLDPKWPQDPFHVLVATILSQRTRDDNTRKASDALFGRYPTLDALADADLSVVEELIRPAGFPKQKAKGVVSCCREIRDVYGGEVPRDTEELVKLPWVGRKTAACVRTYAMGLPSVCVDTHVHRISNLMGLVRTNTPEETEYALMGMTPEGLWGDINRYFVRHGQVVCVPNHMRCGRCAVREHCDHWRGKRRHCRQAIGATSSSHRCSPVLSR